MMCKHNRAMTHGRELACSIKYGQSPHIHPPQTLPYPGPCVVSRLSTPVDPHCAPLLFGLPPTPNTRATHLPYLRSNTPPPHALCWYISRSHFLPPQCQIKTKREPEWASIQYPLSAVARHKPIHSPSSASPRPRVHCVYALSRRNGDTSNGRKMSWTMRAWGGRARKVCLRLN